MDDGLQIVRPLPKRGAKGEAHARTQIETILHPETLPADEREAVVLSRSITGLFGKSSAQAGKTDRVQVVCH